MSYAVIKDWYDEGFDGFGGLVVAKVPKGPRAPRSAPVPRPDGTSSGMGCPKGQIMSDGGSCVAPPGGQKRKYDKSGGGGSASAGDFFPGGQKRKYDKSGGGGSASAGDFFFGPTGGGAPPPLPPPPQPVLPADPICQAPYQLYNGKCVKTGTGGGSTSNTGGGSSVMENYLPPPPQPVIGGGSGGGSKSGDPRGAYADGASSGLVGGGSYRSGADGGVSAGTAFAPSSSGSSSAPAPSYSPNGILQRFSQMMSTPSPTMTPLSPDPGWGPWQTKHAYEAAQSAFAAQTAAAMQPGSNITVVTHVPPPAERMTAPAAPVLATPSYVATGPSAPLLQSAAFEPETKPFPWLLVAAVCAAGVGYYTYTKQNKRGRQ